MVVHHARDCLAHTSIELHILPGQASTLLCICKTCWHCMSIVSRRYFHQKFFLDSIRDYDSLPSFSPTLLLHQFEDEQGHRSPTEVYLQGSLQCPQLLARGIACSWTNHPGAKLLFPSLFHHFQPLSPNEPAEISVTFKIFLVLSQSL